MRIAKIDFPKRLLNALREDKLVVFAGAGVSMGAPACLPSFVELADMIAQGTGEALQAGEPIDRFLGRLQHAGVNVHVLAEEALSCEGREATELHQNLLRIYSDVAQVRVVTTNFDLLFEKASRAVFDDKPEVFRAPALPLGRRFSGIVHVHGAVSHPNEMVLTDLDFSCAYLTEGWARRFLVELFRNFTVLFVGYRHDDTILSYLARALPGGEDGRRFVLTAKDDSDLQRWRLLGIEPISYPQSDQDDHSALYEGISRLVGLVQRSVLDWQREITEIAQRPPPLEAETADLIEDALEDATRTRFFIEAASDPKWIDWLDKRGLLDALFGDGTLNEQDEILSKWLAEKFTYDHADKLFLLIGKHNMGLHLNLWFDLGRKIWKDEDFSLAIDVLSRWISLLLAAIPVHGNSYAFLSGIGKHCIKRGMLDSLLQIFDAMAGSRLFLEEGFVWSDDNNGGDTRAPVDVKLPMLGEHYALDHYALNELWENGLKPKLSQVALPLFERVIRRLEERYLTRCAWQMAERELEPESYIRAAIETHEQDNHPKAVDVLIDAARDCLEWLIQNRRDAAVYWCIHLAGSEVPLFRRLAVHGLSEREDLTADEKIDWLLKHIGLHDLPVHHEVFRAARIAYPEANLEHREAVIEAVRTYRWPDEEDPEREERTAYKHFNWFYWLHKSDSNCTLAKRALDKVLAAYPDFEPSENPDFTHWIDPIRDIVPQSPWSVEELLAKPAVDWLGDLLSFQSTKSFGRDLMGLRDNVAKAAKQDFDWGLSLANALAKSGKWDIHFWSDLIGAWSEMELDEDKHRKVLYWIGKTELHPKYNREIANVLYALVKDGGTSYALNLLPQANKIATALWHHLDRTEQTEERDDWLQMAINRPEGTLARFWLWGFSLWRKEQNSNLATLSDEYHTALSGILQDRELSGRLGRTILVGNLTFLLTVDEVWTQENLLPLFAPDSGDFQAAWDGFMMWGRLSPVVADAMADLFIKAVERIDSDLSEQRDRFIKYYISMLAYFVEDPFDKWIPTLFQYSSQETKDCFATEVGYCLRDLDEEVRREWWQRWLKRYWENRLQGVPTVFEASEVEYMIDWLRHLIEVFPEAVDLAIGMPQTPLQSCYVIHELNEGDLWQKYPEAVAKLLVYLWDCGLPAYTWLPDPKLIDKLLQSDISPELKQQLEELKVQIPQN